MKYNFIEYTDKHTLFEVEDPGHTIAKESSIVLEGKTYDIKYVENIFERPKDGWYLTVKVKEVNVYIRERKSYQLL